MSKYNCLYFLWQWELLLRLEQKVYDHYAEMNLIFDNLDQCITQEEWDRH